MSDNNQTLGDDSRAVSEVLGSVLVFGLVLALIVVLQTTAIPQANAQIEFKHSERVQSDMSELAETTSRVAATGSSSSVQVKTGVQYPTRVIFLNPPPVSGSISTQSLGSVSLANVKATDDETNDYIGSSGPLGPFQTNSIEYAVDYNEYSGGPTTVYEGGVLYNSYENGKVTIADEGNVVSGNRINLMIVDGQLFQSKVGATSVGVKPLSAPTQTVSVTGQGGSNIVITVPTELSADTWRTEILADELQPRGHIASISGVTGSDAVRIELEGSKTYRLQMAKLGVGSGYTEETAHYVTSVGGSKRTVAQNREVTLTAEVRDRFNAPITGESVTFRNADAGTNIKTVTTDSDGQARTSITPATDRTIHAFFGSYDPEGTADSSNPDTPPCDESRKCAVFDVQTVEPTVVGSSINPASANAVALQSSVLVSGTIFSLKCTASGQAGCVEVTLENLDSDTKAIQELRVNFFAATAAGSRSPTANRPHEVVITDKKGNTTSPITIGDDFQPVTLAPIQGNNPKDYVVQFRDENGNPASVYEGDFFVISVIYETPSGSLSTATYFVAPQD